MVRTNSNVKLNDSFIFTTRIQSKLSEGRALRACRTISYSASMEYVVCRLRDGLRAVLLDCVYHKVRDRMANEPTTRRRRAA